MKFSDNTNYQNYMDAFADGRHESAVRFLEKCLKDFSESTYQKAFLLQRLGEIAFLQGDLERSVEYFALAEEADPASLQPKFEFAKFLAAKLERFDAAI